MSHSYHLRKVEPQWYFVDEPNLKLRHVGPRRWRVTGWAKYRQLRQAGFPVDTDVHMSQAEVVASVTAIIGGSGRIRQCSSNGVENIYAIGDTGYQLFRLHGQWRICNDGVRLCPTRFATRAQALSCFQQWYEDPQHQKLSYVDMLATYCS